MGLEPALPSPFLMPTFPGEGPASAGSRAGLAPGDCVGRCLPVRAPEGLIPGLA